MAVLLLNTDHCHGRRDACLKEGELDLEVVCKRGGKNYLLYAMVISPNLRKTCKSNSDNQRECMDIKYSIPRGSLVKPSGVMMYSRRCIKDSAS
jgi:hypothetical protein